MLIPVRAGPGLGQDFAQDPLDLVEVLLPADERRGELDHRVAAVVGAAHQAGLEQAWRGTAQQPFDSSSSNVSGSPCP